MALGRIKIEESATVTAKMATQTLTRNSSAMHQEIVSLGDPLDPAIIAECSSGAPTSSQAGLIVRQVGFSTTVQVSSLGGAVIVRSSAADLLATIYQSSASNLLATIYPQSSAVQNSNSSAVLVRVVGGVSSGVDFPVRALLSSTVTDNVVNVSSVAGAVIVRSSAADQLATVYQSSASNFLATIYPQSSAVQNSNSSAVLVRVVGGVSSGVDFPVRALLSSTVTDNVVNVSSVAGIVAVRGSDTNWASSAGFHFDSSGALQITGGTSSTQVAVSSLAGAVIMRSSAADALVTAYQSSASNFLATIYPQSSAVQNSNSSAVLVRVVGGVSSGVDFPTRAQQSSASDLKVSAFLFDSTGNAIDASTQSMSSGARGVFVRPVIPGSTTYAASTAGQSSATTILSSAAATRGYVYAYSITSTLAGPVQWGFYDANGPTLKWTGILAAVSSAISGANLAVTPPGYLFRGTTGAGLTFNCATSNAGLSVSVAMFRST